MGRVLLGKRLLTATSSTNNIFCNKSKRVSPVWIILANHVFFLSLSRYAVGKFPSAHRKGKLTRSSSLLLRQHSFLLLLIFHQLRLTWNLVITESNVFFDLNVYNNYYYYFFLCFDKYLYFKLFLNIYILKNIKQKIKK